MDLTEKAILELINYNTELFRSLKKAEHVGIDLDILFMSARSVADNGDAVIGEYVGLSQDVTSNLIDQQVLQDKNAEEILQYLREFKEGYESV